MMAWENTLLVHLEQSDIVIIWSVILINKLQSVACFFISSCNQDFLVVQQAQFFFSDRHFPAKQAVTSHHAQNCIGGMYMSHLHRSFPTYEDGSL